MSRQNPISRGERLAALQSITLEMTQAECPCGDCMGKGCEKCAMTGADLDSLKTIRAAFASALDVVAASKRPVIEKLSQELRDL